MKAAPDGGPSEEDTSELRPGKPEVGAAWGGVGRLMLPLEGRFVGIDRDQGSTNLHPKSQLLEDAPTTGPLGWFLVVGMGTTPWSGGVCRPFNW